MGERAPAPLVCLEAPVFFSQDGQESNLKMQERVILIAGAHVSFLKRAPIVSFKTVNNLESLPKFARDQ